MFKFMISAVFCLSFVPLTAFAQKTPDAEKYAKQKVDPAEVHEIVEIGRRVVDRVEGASAHLVVKNNVDGALAELTMAMMDISTLQKRSLAYQQTHDVVNKKGLVKKSDASLDPGMIPLYEDLTLWSAMGEKQHQQAKAPSPVVTQVQWQEIRRVLDLNIAEKKVKKAVRLLVTQKTPDAIETLQSFYGEAVFYDINTAAFPLYQVAQNLMFAKVALEDQNDRDTQVALKGAVNALEAYEKIAPDGLKDDVTYLKKVIDVRVDVISSEPDRGAALVQSWWDKVIDWSHNE